MHGTTSQKLHSKSKIIHFLFFFFIHIIAKNPDIKKKNLSEDDNIKPKTFTLRMTEFSVHQVSRLVCQTLEWWVGGK